MTRRDEILELWRNRIEQVKARINANTLDSGKQYYRDMATREINEIDRQLRALGVWR